MSMSLHNILTYIKYTGVFVYKSILSTHMSQNYELWTISNKMLCKKVATLREDTAVMFLTMQQRCYLNVLNKGKGKMWKMGRICVTSCSYYSKINEACCINKGLHFFVCVFGTLTWNTIEIVSLANCKNNLELQRIIEGVKIEVGLHF